MKYLVHCILRNPVLARGPAGMRTRRLGAERAGAGNSPTTGGARPAAHSQGVAFFESGNLAAAVTRHGGGSAPPDATQLLGYERVISNLHAAGPVIPLRYGCLVEDEAAAARLLEEGRVGYEALLERLENRVEMGLRVLWDTPADSPPVPTPATPGAAYLAAARRRRGVEAELTPAEREWAVGMCAGLSDLYSEQRQEARFAGAGRLVSLYFLVPRPSVRRFRGRLRRIVSCQGRGFLVSGPWPPYNFVNGAASQ
jgi:gas vesicle protein GvpL/GvpF